MRAYVEFLLAVQHHRVRIQDFACVLRVLRLRRTGPWFAADGDELALVRPPMVCLKTYSAPPEYSRGTGRSPHSDFEFTDPVANAPSDTEYRECSGGTSDDSCKTSQEAPVKLLL